MYYRWTKTWLPPSRQKPSSHSSLMHPLSHLSVPAGAGHPFTNIIPVLLSQTDPKIINSVQLWRISPLPHMLHPWVVMDRREGWIESEHMVVNYNVGADVLVFWRPVDWKCAILWSYRNICSLHRRKWVSLLCVKKRLKKSFNFIQLEFPCDPKIQACLQSFVLFYL